MKYYSCIWLVFVLISSNVYSQILSNKIYYVAGSIDSTTISIKGEVYRNESSASGDEMLEVFHIVCSNKELLNKEIKILNKVNVTSKWRSNTPVTKTFTFNVLKKNRKFYFCFLEYYSSIYEKDIRVDFKIKNVR